MTDFFDDQSTIVVFIVGVGVALWLIIQSIAKIWPFLSRLVTMVNGFVGHDGEPGLLDRVKSLEADSAHEQRNHNKMSDQLDRVEVKVNNLTRRFDEFSQESLEDRNKLWNIARTHHQGEIEE